MIGAFLGFVVCLILSLFDVTSWWWLLWGSLIGLLTEIIIRVGGGSGVGEAICDIGDCVGSIGDSIGDCGGGGDCGGDGGGSSGCGGGGD